MNTRSIISNIILPSIIILTGCSTIDDQYTGSDNIITLTRELPAFTKIEAESCLEVNITQNKTQVLEIMVNDNLQEQITTTVANNTLFISLRDGTYRNDNFVVNIQLPTLERLELNDDTNGKVDFTADQLEFDVNDSSELSLQGASKILNANIDDDGKISAYKFIAEIVNAKVNDDSEFLITCTKELNGTVDDSSEIRYKGMPIINAQTSDDGRIINAN